MRHFSKEENFKKIFSKNVLLFLSLRYSGDFRRSRLVVLHHMRFCHGNATEIGLQYLVDAQHQFKPNALNTTQ